jgi:hypothetical protein
VLAITTRKKALLDIAADVEQNGQTGHEAGSLAASIDKLATAFMVQVWNNVPARYDDTSIMLSLVVTM